MSSFCYDIIWVYIPELFPATIRANASGFLKICGLSGTIVSPYLIEAVVERNIPPVFVLGCMFFCSSWFILICNETYQKELLNEIPELKPHRKSISEIRKSSGTFFKS